MRNITSWLIALILLLSLVVTVVTDRISARQHAADQATMSAFDMAMEIRTTSPETGGRGNTMLFGAGILALAVVVFGGAILAMSNGGELLKQARLNRRRQGRPRPSLTISGPERPPQPDIQQLPAVPSLRRLPPVEEGYYQE